MAKRKVEEVSVGPELSSQVANGQRQVEVCGGVRPELVGMTVAHTIGDGLCFLRAVLQQLRMNPDHVWKLAMVVLRYMHQNMVVWQAHAVADESLAERLEALQHHNLLRYLQAAFPTYYHANCASVPVIEGFEAHAVLLDRAHGIMLRDWSDPRLYCDHVFIQQFLNLVGAKLLLVELSQRPGPPVAELRGTTLVGDGGFVLKMVHYGDAPEHFNVVMDTEDRQFVLREELKSRVEGHLHSMGSSYWWPRVDVHAIAEELLSTLAAAHDVTVSSTDSVIREEIVLWFARFWFQASM